MTHQPSQLTRDQKVWASLFILAFGFSLCLCTPLSPVLLLDRVVTGPVITELVRPLIGFEVHVLGVPVPLEKILAFLFGITSGCLLTIISLFAFIFVTVHAWRSERRSERKSILELQQRQLELERQRLELEKQRLALEKKRQGIEEGNEGSDFEI